MNLIKRIRDLFTPDQPEPGRPGQGDLMGHPGTEDQMPSTERRPQDTANPPLPLSEEVRPPTQR